MFDEIINEAKANVSSLLQEQHGMGIEEANNTSETIGKSFMGIVQQQVSNKEFSAVKEIFSGSNTPPEHPEIQKMIPQLSKSLIDNGIDAAKAGNISASVLPQLFNMFNDKVATAKQNGIDIPGMIEKFSSGGFGLGNLGSMMSMAGSFLKGGKSGMMADMLSKFTKKNP